MEYLIFFSAFLFLILVVTVQEIVAAKKNRQRLKESLLRTFGTNPAPIKAERWEYIQGYFKKHQSEYAIDDITWNDLEMDHFFEAINFTQSSLGEEYLYAMLRNCSLAGEEAKEFEDLCHYMSEEAEHRSDLQILFRSIGHTGKFSIYDYLDHVEELGNRSSKLSILTDVCILLSFIGMPFFFYPCIAIVVFLLVFNIVSYFREKNILSLYITSFLFILRLIVHGEEIVKVEIPCFAEAKEMESLLKGLHPMTRGMGMIAKINSPITGSNPLDLITDYLKMAFHIDLILFNRMYGKLLQNIDELDKLFGVLGKLEAAIAVAAFRASLPQGFCTPCFSDGGKDTLIIKDGYHPLINHAVPNSICANKGLLITGSNASGKSTFLKMTALNILLAQSIHTVAAKEYYGFRCHLFSSMSLRDDLESGNSYFLVEIKAIKRILDASTRENMAVICFVDEVLRGTNTIERIAASTQILKALNHPTILTFAATHDMELTYLLEQEYENYHFEESIQESDVAFTYQLLTGRAHSKNAILLLNSMGYDNKLTDEAKRLVERFERTGKWTEE